MYSEAVLVFLETELVSSEFSLSILLEELVVLSSTGLLAICKRFSKELIFVSALFVQP